ncbi:MAG: phenylalanine--tRNA ligase subunit beta [Candidatus Peregrinibacteria bacterium]|nr:phenylalanine--tRNA ligase subunit beta [Candidatus Peregrinibacteria bacterium]
MKISLNWLSDFVELTERDPKVIADRVTEGTAEVDEVTVQGELLEKCVVGKVLSVTKHPQADRLSLCEVMTDKGKKRVVCGGTNLRVGMRVAFAHVGARVRWHGTEITTLEKTKIRSEESEGMICAAEELDLSTQFPESKERVIIDMGDGDADVGKPLKRVLGLDDVVLHIDNHAITQRPDLFSHVGFAREFVALGLARWRKQPLKKRPIFSKAAMPFAFKNDIPTLVPRYASCIIQIDSAGKTPEWMERRLTATGWRLVNLPVDITNYVAMETGMPLHSFDADDLKGTVHICQSKKGEKITTLDEVARPLPDGAIVLSDDEGIFDLMGIMGGLRSSTKATTKRIYLHSTIVDPVSIRRAIIATGHRTDAATVYEKGIPRVTCMLGFTRALELILELVPGARIVSKMEEWGDDGKGKPIAVSVARAQRTLGEDIPAKTMTRILTDLGCTVKSAGSKAKGTTLTVTPPLFRLGDMRGEHDVIEEIGRIYGYNTIAVTMPAASIDPQPRDKRVHWMREYLKEEGYTEILPLSLVGASLLRKAELDPAEAIAIQNPIGEEESLFQTSTLPRLLEHAQRNLLTADGELKTFLWGHVLRAGGIEHTEMSMLLWCREEKDLKSAALLTLKENLLYALSPLGLSVSVTHRKDAPLFAHPGRDADIRVEGVTMGQLYELHPKIAQRFDLLGRAAIATIDLDSLFSLPVKTKVVSPLPLFPAVTYDITARMAHAKAIDSLLKKLESSHELLEKAQIADLYAGTGMEKGKYNVTIRCTYRSPERTLREDEAQAAHKTVEELVTEYAK